MGAPCIYNTSKAGRNVRGRYYYVIPSMRSVAGSNLGRIKLFPQGGGRPGFVLTGCPLAPCNLSSEINFRSR